RRSSTGLIVEFLSATGRSRRPHPAAGEFCPGQDLLASSSNLSKRSTPWIHVRLRQRPVPGGRPQLRSGAGRECRQWSREGRQWSQSETSAEQKYPSATNVGARPRGGGGRAERAGKPPQRP